MDNPSCLIHCLPYIYAFYLTIFLFLPLASPAVVPFAMNFNDGYQVSVSLDHHFRFTVSRTRMR